jgi:hypothetical protein
MGDQHPEGHGDIFKLYSRCMVWINQPVMHRKGYPRDPADDTKRFVSLNSCHIAKKSDVCDTLVHNSLEVYALVFIYCRKRVSMWMDAFEYNIIFVNFQPYQSWTFHRCTSRNNSSRAAGRFQQKGILGYRGVWKSSQQWSERSLTPQKLTKWESL